MPDSRTLRSNASRVGGSLRHSRAQVTKETLVAAIFASLPKFLIADPSWCSWARYGPILLAPFLPLTPEESDRPCDVTFRKGPPGCSPSHFGSSARSLLYALQPLWYVISINLSRSLVSWISVIPFATPSQ